MWFNFIDFGLVFTSGTFILNYYLNFKVQILIGLNLKNNEVFS